MVDGLNCFVICCYLELTRWLQLKFIKLNFWKISAKCKFLYEVYAYRLYEIYQKEYYLVLSFGRDIKPSDKYDNLR